MQLFHGGIPGRAVGDLLIPAPPRVTDGCPICVARAAGRICTVGEYRAWLIGQGPRAIPVLAMLKDAPDELPIDPPSKHPAVYVTTNRDYARWYAARSAGDLYRVEPLGDQVPSDEDPFPSWTVERAQIVEVIERRVRLDRRDRRSLMRAWGKADKAWKLARAATGELALSAGGAG